MKRNEILSSVLCLFLVSGFVGTAIAQDSDTSPYSFTGSGALVSKYIWRGQRLTNDWSFQPSMTFAGGGFSFNAWGTVDLAAVNEGSSLLIPENPLAGSSASGLKGKFSEVDYTFSYARSFQGVTVDGGTIFYTFPERSSFLASTAELYGGVKFDSIPLAPSAKLFVDVDESVARDNTGFYLSLGASRSIPFNHPVFTGLDLSGTLSFANGGFSHFYYGAAEEKGAHDTSLTVSVPMRLNENWSASAFVTYSGLIGDFRDYQFRDARDVYRGTASSPSEYADTVWGGFSINLGF